MDGAPPLRYLRTFAALTRLVLVGLIAMAGLAPVVHLVSASSAPIVVEDATGERRAVRSSARAGRSALPRTRRRALRLAERARRALVAWRPRSAILLPVRRDPVILRL
jgi:hypothetical protein